MSCGFCCDGTLFDKAKSYEQKDDAVIAALGLTSFEQEEKKFFRLPCQHFDGKCTVYDQLRPKTCGKFFCEPIRKVRRGEKTTQEVQELIDKVKILRKQFREVIAQQHPELQQLSLVAVRLMLLGPSEDEQKKLRRRYPSLYIIGLKLFPLIRQFYKEKE
ncbi:MAG: YkgJ family cysteine cluster protein [Flavobacteriales bacterium]